MSSWHSAALSVWKGLMAPSAMDLSSSGTTRAQSMPITRPKPRQVGQAPMGELKEKLLGIGVR